MVKDRPLDDCLYAPQATIPYLTRSSLHRCLQRHGISRLPEVTGDKEPKRKFKTYPTAHLHDFINAYNFGRRLKTLRGLTPYEYICKCSSDEPQRFTLNPHHQSPGPNT